MPQPVNGMRTRWAKRTDQPIAMGGNVSSDALLVNSSHHNSPDKEERSHRLNEEGASLTKTGGKGIGSKVKWRTAFVTSEVTKTVRNTEICQSEKL
jgi:hypothetical protein